MTVRVTVIVTVTVSFEVPKLNGLVPTYREYPKKIDWAKFQMLKFSGKTCTLWWFFSLDSGHPKSAEKKHLAIRHIGGFGWGPDNTDVEVYWVKVNCSNVAGFWTSWGPRIICFQKKILEAKSRDT